MQQSKEQVKGQEIPQNNTDNDKNVPVVVNTRSLNSKYGNMFRNLSQIPEEQLFAETFNAEGPTPGPQFTEMRSLSEVDRESGKMKTRKLKQLKICQKHREQMMNMFKKAPKNFPARKRRNGNEKEVVDTASMLENLAIE